MKVGDLKKGMMLMPSINKWTERRQKFKLKYETSECGKTFLYAAVTSQKRSTSDTDIAIYMGHERSDFYIYGIKKHHFLLIDGKLSRTTGYEFRWIDAVE